MLLVVTACGTARVDGVRIRPESDSYGIVRNAATGKGIAGVPVTDGYSFTVTDSRGVYQMKRSKNVKHYAHLEHSTGDATMYRMFGLDYFDSVLVTGNYKEKDVRYLEELRGIAKKEIVFVFANSLMNSNSQMMRILQLKKKLKLFLLKKITNSQFWFRHPGGQAEFSLNMEKNFWILFLTQAGM